MVALSWQQRFPSLAYRNYRLWLVARISWTIGVGLQSTAASFLAYELTHSTAYMGSVSFSFGIPILLFSAYGGVLADRFDRRTLVTALQICWLVPALFLAILTFLHVIQAWHLFIWGLGIGIIHALDNPARMAFMPDLVSRDDLTNASMLSQLVFQSGTVLAPGIAGIAYARFGSAWSFLLSVFAFLPALISYVLIRTTPAPRERARMSAGSQISEALRYARTQPMERSLLILIALMTMFGTATVLLPAWAVDILHGDAATNGLLNSARAVGTVLAVASIALLGRINYKGKLLTVVTFILPITWLAFAQTRLLPLSVLALVGVGAFTAPILTLSGVLLQLLVPDALRGRLMGIVNVANVGMSSLGSLLIGIVAQAFGSPNAIVLAAVALLAVALAIYLSTPGLRKLE